MTGYIRKANLQIVSAAAAAGYSEESGGGDDDDDDGGWDDLSGGGDCDVGGSVVPGSPSTRPERPLPFASPGRGGDGSSCIGGSSSGGGAPPRGLIGALVPPLSPGAFGFGERGSGAAPPSSVKGRPSIMPTAIHSAGGFSEGDGASAASPGGSRFESPYGSQHESRFESQYEDARGGDESALDVDGAVSFYGGGGPDEGADSGPGLLDPGVSKFAYAGSDDEGEGGFGHGAGEYGYSAASFGGFASGNSEACEEGDGAFDGSSAPLSTSGLGPSTVASAGGPGPGALGPTGLPLSPASPVHVVVPAGVTTRRGGGGGTRGGRWASAGALGDNDDDDDHRECASRRASGPGGLVDRSLSDATAPTYGPASPGLPTRALAPNHPSSSGLEASAGSGAFWGPSESNGKAGGCPGGGCGSSPAPVVQVSGVGAVLSAGGVLEVDVGRRSDGVAKAKAAAFLERSQARAEEARRRAGAAAEEARARQRHDDMAAAAEASTVSFGSAREGWGDERGGWGDEGGFSPGSTGGRPLSSAEALSARLAVGGSAANGKVSMKEAKARSKRLFQDLPEVGTPPHCTSAHAATVYARLCSQFNYKNLTLISRPWRGQVSSARKKEREAKERAERVEKAKADDRARRLASAQKKRLSGRA